MCNISSAADMGPTEILILITSFSVFYQLVQRFRRSVSTPLKGPPSTVGNFVLGVIPELARAPDAGAVHEEWAAQYGSVYSIPFVLGSRKIMFADPNALAHFFSRETYGYVATSLSRRFTEMLIGRGLFWAEGDSYKRQRRALNPAFTMASIKSMSPIFFDSAYKAKAAWDALVESGPAEGTIIEVQQWMNHVSLDTTGLAGFSHDFRTLSGKTSDVGTAFDSIGSRPSAFDRAIFLSSLIVPVLGRIPHGRHTNLARLRETIGDSGADKSVIGLLVESATTEKISHEEVIAQINVLLVAGYETTASESVIKHCLVEHESDEFPPLQVSLTWALIVLSRHQEIQTKLRDELLKFGGDLTWEELTSHTTFLDAVTSEILRLHAPLAETSRIATEDDVIPLSKPLETARGAPVESVFLRKGTTVGISFHSINRSEAFWGPDARVFNPGRWLDAENGGDELRAREIQGYRHILTFSDGPRMCLRRVFALAEFKAVLSVLVRNFTFEFPGGPDTAIGQHVNILPRPKVEGESGYSVPLRVRQHVG
ncbi:cytochrome P450 [Mycena metata]|uniref:Cytochrome P450 n=1 Tax=Mycena metata TaxID=1033252 RepID=A0AAD7HRC5_9AGAR|nr:cytochrome P450 [Mycena metata]